MAIDDIGIQSIKESNWMCEDCKNRIHKCHLCQKEGIEGDLVNKSTSRSFVIYDNWKEHYENKPETKEFTEEDKDTLYFILDTLNLPSTLVKDPRYQALTKLEPVVRCKQPRCGYFYHPTCIINNPIAKRYDNHLCSFRCPLHYCKLCNTTITNMGMAICLRCCDAYHFSCLPKVRCIKIRKKYIVCPKHIPEGVDLSQYNIRTAGKKGRYR